VKIREIFCGRKCLQTGMKMNRANYIAILAFQLAFAAVSFVASIAFVGFCVYVARIAWDAAG